MAAARDESTTRLATRSDCSTPGRGRILKLNGTLERGERLWVPGATLPLAAESLISLVGRNSRMYHSSSSSSTTVLGKTKQQANRPHRRGDKSETDPNGRECKEPHTTPLRGGGGLGCGTKALLELRDRVAERREPS